jgi:hypothetical protein
MSIIQTILVISLESRVFYRNDSIRKNVEEHRGSPEYESCDINIQYSVERMMRIEQENAIFMIFQLYQLWFCFNAVRNKKIYLKPILINLFIYRINIFLGFCSKYVSTYCSNSHE